MILYGYWRSTASYRVRIALNVKGVAYEQVTLDLRTGVQRTAEHLLRQPQGLVPAVQVQEATLLQSPAILEWLDETYSTPPLLPPDRTGRAVVRAMAAIIGCDIHPLNNLRILDFLRSRFAAEPSHIENWMTMWMHEGFRALEIMIERYGGEFSFGDSLTIADCYLLPQVYSAERFGVDLTKYTRIRAVASRSAEIPAVALAHPDRQPDADR